MVRGPQRWPKEKPGPPARALTGLKAQLVGMGAEAPAKARQKVPFWVVHSERHVPTVKAWCKQTNRESPQEVARRESVEAKKAKEEEAAERQRRLARKREKAGNWKKLRKLRKRRAREAEQQQRKGTEGAVGTVQEDEDIVDESG
eukprot:RCo028373